MYVIAFVYNNNGMATWCWEAAHALSEAGQPVLLVCQDHVVLPSTPQVEVVRFTPPAVEKPWIKRKWEKVKGEPAEFTFHLHQHLRQQGVSPSAYLLNQPDMYDDRVSAPQHVAGWACPSSLRGYLAKIPKYNGPRWHKDTLAICRGWLVIWRKDWRGYRGATSVLAVSQRLGSELRAKGVNAHVVHPGTHVTAARHSESPPPCRLLVAALDLEEPRKRVRWMVEALKRKEKRNFHLTLIGNASESFRRWVCQDEFPATFTGHIPRDAVQRLMVENDVFLFGSSLDDWGYVLVEAMANGLIVVAPNESPFDEIVHNTGGLYSLRSQEDFGNEVQKAIDNYREKSCLSWERAEACFSRRAFARSLLAAIQK